MLQELMLAAGLILLCLGGCPPMTIIIEHGAYKKTEISISAGGDKIIKLEKLVH